MKILKNKTKTSAITFVLVLTISAIMVTFPTSKAQTSTLPTNAYLNVSPNPAGVNQEVTCLMWLLQFEPTAKLVGKGGGWENYTLLITKPDGTTQTLGPFAADDASFAYAIYAPDQIGTYTIEFTFPGQYVKGKNFMGQLIDIFYEGSSFTVTLTVQQESIEPYPQTPIPTEYWTRPINSQNFDWHTISGNWLGTGSMSFRRLRMGYSHYDQTGNFNPYTTAPNTGHVVWTKSLVFGGLLGGEFGGTPTSHYYSGKTYEPAFGPPVIIDGVLYYNGPACNPGDQGFYAVDLRTGETLWHQNRTTSITCGQVYNCVTPNQEGGIPYLWSISGSTWYMYDAFTGNLILQIANATLGNTASGTYGNIVQGPNGELLVYVLDNANNWLAMWNSTKCILSICSDKLRWRPIAGAEIDFQEGIQWNVTTQSYPDQGIDFINSGVILAVTGNMFMPQSWQMEIGYNMTTGEQLWVQNRTIPTGQTNWGLMGPIANGVYAEFHKTTMQWYGFSVYTGEQIWGPSEPYTNAWGSITTDSTSAMSAYGILYGSSIDGIHALNITTGETLWNFYADSSGVDFPGFNTYPFETNMLYTIADGKFFASTGDSHGVPLFRGARLYAIDAYSGEEVWNINGYYQTTMPVADGYLVAFNLYDSRLYCFGKGQTAATVSAPETTIPLGEEVLIKGTVTDQSPGAEGTPAIADEYMSEWMEYVYMQQPCPENAEGVEVVISTLDPNGNTYELGRTITDMDGTFGCVVDPPVPGKYKIIATFEGSDSYYGSSAKTYINVEEAPSPAQTIEPGSTGPEPTEPTEPEPTEPTEPAPTEPEPTEPEPTEPAEAPLITTETAIIAAVIVAVIIGIAAYWQLRKRK